MKKENIKEKELFKDLKKFILADELPLKNSNDLTIEEKNISEFTFSMKDYSIVKPARKIKQVILYNNNYNT